MEVCPKLPNSNISFAWFIVCSHFRSLRAQDEAPRKSKGKQAQNEKDRNDRASSGSILRYTEHETWQIDFPLAIRGRLRKPAQIHMGVSLHHSCSHAQNLPITVMIRHSQNALYCNWTANQQSSVSRTKNVAHNWPSLEMIAWRHSAGNLVYFGTLVRRNG